MDKIKTTDLFDCCTPYLKQLFAFCEYPWQILVQIEAYIQVLLENGIDGFSYLRKDVLVGRDVRVAPTATIDGPAILGHGCELRPGAYIRGHVIAGRACVFGNSCEYKHCILLDDVQTPHYNYIGDSILGNRAHTGAGTICSNLKGDGRPVVVRGEQMYETGLRKLGAILADGANVGCACVLNPGTVIGRDTTVYPNLSLRGVFGSNVVVKAQDRIVSKYDEKPS